MDKATQLLDQGQCKGAYNQLETLLGTATIRSLDAAQFNRLAIVLADAEVCLGRYDHALELVNSPRVPPGPTVLYLRAEAEKGKGLYPEATVDYAKALGSSSPEAGSAVRIYAGAAELSRLKGDFPEAAKRAQQALTLSARLPPGAIERAYAALAAAGLALDREAFAEATTQYAQARKVAETRGPDHWLAARASLGLGLVDLQRGRLDAAELELKKADEATHQKMSASDVFLQVSDAIAMLKLAKGEQAGAKERSNLWLAEPEEDLKDTLGSEKNFRGKQHPDTARTQSHLGVLYLARNDAAKAIAELGAAEAVQRSLLGPLHPDLAYTLSYLGRAYQTQGKVQEAKRAFDEALAIQESALGKNSLAAAATRVELATLAPGAGSEAAYRGALAIEDGLITKDSPLRMRTVRELGLLLHRNGQHKEADALLAEWLKGKGQSLPSSDNERFTVDFAQAEISLDQRNFPLAEQQFGAVLKQAAGKTPQVLNAARKGLADSLFGQQKFREAASLYEAVLPVMPAQPAVVNAWMNLSSSYAEQKRWNESMKAAQNALGVSQRANGPRAERAGILFSIVSMSAEAGRATQVTPYIDQWLESKKSNGESLSNVEARLIDRLSKDLSAGQHYARAEEMLRLILSKRNTQALQGMNVNDLQLRLAEVSAAQKKYGEAAELYETVSRRMRVVHRPADAEALLVKARDVREKSPGDLKRIATKQALAQSYVLNRKYADARALYEQTIEALPQRQTDTAPPRAAALDGLGTIAQAEKKFDQATSLYEQARAILTQPGAKPPATILAAVLFHVGALKMSNGDSKGANEAFEGCLKLSRERPADDQIPPVEQYDQIAGAYLTQGRYDDAEKLYLENLDERRKFFGENSADEGWGYYSLANFYLARKVYTKSSDYGQRSLKIFGSAAGAESEEVALASELLASSYGASGDLDNAIEATANAEHIQEKLGRPKLEITTTLSTLAQLQSRRRNFTEAKKVYQNMEKLWEPESVSNPNYLLAVKGLAVTCAYLKEFPESQDWYNRLSTALRNDPIQLSKAAESYATALKANGRAKDAKKILEQSTSRTSTRPNR